MMNKQWLTEKILETVGKGLFKSCSVKENWPVEGKLDYDDVDK